MKILITGATHGMGRGVARALAAHPQTELVLLGRSEQLLRETAAELSQCAAPERVRVIRCDLAKMRDVRAALAELRDLSALDAVFVNAGIGYAPRHEKTEDGLDAHFQVNYLSQFMLTLNLLELLEASKQGGRVVFNAPAFGEVRWDDLQLDKGWDYELAIGQAMVAKRMFAARLHELYAARGEPRVSCFSYEIAKTVWTNQLNVIPRPMRLMATVMKAFGRFISVDECGDIMAPLFLEGREECAKKSGRLLTTKGGELHDREKNPEVLDAAARKRLWDVSLALCGDEATARAAQRLTAPPAALAPTP